MRKLFIFIRLVCVVLVLLVLTATSIRIFRNIKQAEIVGQVLSEIDNETEIVDISRVEKLLVSHNMHLIEYSVVNDKSNIVITRKSSERYRLVSMFSVSTNWHEWSLSPAEYRGKEGTFPVFLCEKIYNVKGSILKVEAIIRN